jgi:hypothetical protein
MRRQSELVMVESTPGMMLIQGQDLESSSGSDQSDSMEFDGPTERS